MNKHFVLGMALVSVAGASSAQVFQRRASITGRASGDREKCTIEVVVDGAAEVELRGDSAVLRNLSGQPPQWRRFECSAPMPSNPVNFQFHGVDGRGRQQLVRDPRGGGPAVVRIEDPDNGAEGYTFDVTWGGGFQENRGGFEEHRGVPPEQPSYPAPYPPYREEPRSQSSITPGIESCQHAVEDQLRHDGYDRVNVQSIRAEDRPGGGDRVLGSVFAEGRSRRPETFNFACTVNLERGTVRRVDITPR